MAKPNLIKFGVFLLQHMETRAHEYVDLYNRDNAARYCTWRRTKVGKGKGLGVMKNSYSKPCTEFMT